MEVRLGVAPGRAQSSCMRRLQGAAPDRFPQVPVSGVASSKRELSLLSGWPKFDLYRRSNSKELLAAEVALTVSKYSTPSYGWLMATPRVNPRP